MDNGYQLIEILIIIKSAFLPRVKGCMNFMDDESPPSNYSVKGTAAISELNLSKPSKHARLEGVNDVLSAAAKNNILQISNIVLHNDGVAYAPKVTIFALAWGGLFAAGGSRQR
ncbi:hypothetical protein [Janthinobacterium sp. AD80]|uniref:hypothetical protein n=1 Tax=unclassified Janthinobacterium TaxID=2610881 RepID=UPI0011AEE097|nr:hypothetical protein [Janthinobacterium sp. AD80]